MHPILRTALAAAISILAGCAPFTVHLEPVQPPWQDASSVSPALVPGKCASIMIVPPSGTARSEFESLVATAERAFMRRGIRVISPAITARVVQQSEGLKEGGAATLSDVERALMLAESSNADAILQVGRFEATGKSPLAHRYFAAPPGKKQLVECGLDEFRAAAAAGRVTWDYRADVLDFSGRLIDVRSGEVLASFAISVPFARVADPHDITLDAGPVLLSQNYDWESEENARVMAGRAMDFLFDHLAVLIAREDTAPRGS
ncbi:MAG: hypothetical protein Fur0037_23990 [Planctomycetota bacterium]